MKPETKFEIQPCSSQAEEREMEIEINTKPYEESSEDAVQNICLFAKSFFLFLESIKNDEEFSNETLVANLVSRFNESKFNVYKLQKSYTSDLESSDLESSYLDLAQIVYEKWLFYEKNNEDTKELIKSKKEFLSFLRDPRNKSVIGNFQNAYNHFIRSGSFIQRTTNLFKNRLNSQEKPLHEMYDVWVEIDGKNEDSNSSQDGFGLIQKNRDSDNKIIKECSKGDDDIVYESIVEYQKSLQGSKHFRKFYIGEIQENQKEKNEFFKNQAPSFWDRIDGLFLKSNVSLFLLAMSSYVFKGFFTDSEEGEEDLSSAFLMMGAYMMSIMFCLKIAFFGNNNQVRKSHERNIQSNISFEVTKNLSCVKRSVHVNEVSDKVQNILKKHNSIDIIDEFKRISDLVLVSLKEKHQTCEELTKKKKHIINEINSFRSFLDKNENAKDFQKQELKILGRFLDFYHQLIISIDLTDINRLESVSKNSNPHTFIFCGRMMVARAFVNALYNISAFVGIIDFGESNKTKEACMKIFYSFLGLVGYGALLEMPEQNKAEKQPINIREASNDAVLGIQRKNPGVTIGSNSVEFGLMSLYGSFACITLGILGTAYINVPQAIKLLQGTEHSDETNVFSNGTITESPEESNFDLNFYIGIMTTVFFVFGKCIFPITLMKSLREDFNGFCSNVAIFFRSKLFNGQNKASLKEIADSFKKLSWGNKGLVFDCIRFLSFPITNLLNMVSLYRPAFMVDCFSTTMADVAHLLLTGGNGQEFIGLLLKSFIHKEDSVFQDFIEILRSEYKKLEIEEDSCRTEENDDPSKLMISRIDRILKEKKFDDIYTNDFLMLKDILGRDTPEYLKEAQAIPVFSQIEKISKKEAAKVFGKIVKASEKENQIRSKKYNGSEKAFISSREICEIEENAQIAIPINFDEASPDQKIRILASSEHIYKIIEILMKKEELTENDIQNIICNFDEIKRNPAELQSSQLPINVSSIHLLKLKNEKSEGIISMPDELNKLSSDHESKQKNASCEKFSKWMTNVCSDSMGLYIKPPHKPEESKKPNTKLEENHQSSHHSVPHSALSVL